MYNYVYHIRPRGYKRDYKPKNILHVMALIRNVCIFIKHIFFFFCLLQTYTELFIKLVLQPTQQRIGTDLLQLGQVCENSSFFWEKWRALEHSAASANDRSSMFVCLRVHLCPSEESVGQIKKNKTNKNKKNECLLFCLSPFIFHSRQFYHHHTGPCPPNV